jgi:HdeA/HdeB family
LKTAACLLVALLLAPAFGHASELNVAAVSCSKYENEVLPASGSNGNPDSINTVMWLFGYAVGRSGEKVMYGDALSSFGFALDAQCKSAPNQTLSDAVAQVRPVTKNPMQLTELSCATFAKRHTDLLKSDRESADTIMMWLLGFSVAANGGRVLDGAALGRFETALLADCAAAPTRTLYEELLALKGGATAPH